jgi:uroporphyrinogen III methyltransferase/synthase
MRDGKVYLVGAGPGDPGLLTLKAMECLAEAEVVVYDYLANPIFLQYADERAELIYVGKKGGAPSRSQQEINQLIISKAQQGLRVVRLKGGDPFIFGRGGEEAQDLVAAGVPFEVIPGVTSAIAVPAYAGIPLTHRDYTATVAFVTGHEDPKKMESNIAWDKLATGVGTLVFLMGMGNLPTIVERLMAHGRSPDTPIAVIHRGTMPEQKTVVGRLEDIVSKVREAQLEPPSVIVVGEIARLRSELNWFEARPLFGKRIVVTRARAQASRFLRRLTELGAECIEFPTIEIAPPESWEALDDAIRGLEGFKWLLFTSVNGVEHFFQRLELLQKDARDLKGLQIGTIGPETAQAVQTRGVKPDFVPTEYRAEAIVDQFRKWDVKGTKILLPRAARAREILPTELEKMGAEVRVVPAYQTIIPRHDADRVDGLLAEGRIDLVTFTSSSTVTNFVDMLGVNKESLKALMSQVIVACIGPVTAETARKIGFSVAVMPATYTIEALTESIVQYFGSHQAEER